WQTFYEAGNRLAFYLKYHNFNSVLLSVSADGSAIYPSRHLAPTPRYDSGVYHSSGQDVVRKDVLEMLFQIFDREQLTLMPELQFSSVLTGLEQSIQEDSAQAAGIELVNQYGQTWRNAKGTTRGQAPYYNPLNPLVQNEIADIFSELVTRYKNHPSFQGVAVQLSLNGYLQLPGLDWGYDDFTVSQFEKETGVKVPAASDSAKYEKRYLFLTTTAFPQWTQWRCQKIKELHQRLADVLAKERPDAQIVFAAKELLPAHSKEGDVISSLKAGAQFRPVLMELGLDFSSYDQIRNAVVLRPEQFYANQKTASAAQILNTHPTVDDAFKMRVNGTLYYHHPVEVRIAEFDSISPWQPAFTWLVAQASPAGAANRMRYVHSIAQQDPYLVFDGGWTIPFGQEQATQVIRVQLQKLPARPFQTIETAKQPVIARLSRGKDRTCFYLVNDFPYACQAVVELNSPSGKPVIHLASGEAVTTSRSPAGGMKYSIDLEAFDFQAFEIHDALVQITSIDCKVQGTD
ncbi:MAG: family 10 glycosylhydrolase, partial [Planctomycetaceae bacterium]|nr:family 10 glycosylhydrolase [Planctomycetaceae bacterium]